MDTSCSCSYRVSPCSVLKILENIGNFADPQLLGDLRGVNTSFDQILTPIYFDKIGKTIQVVEYGRGSFKIVSNSNANVNKKVFTRDDWTDDLAERFRKIIISQYNFVPGPEEEYLTIEEIAKTLAPHITHIELNKLTLCQLSCQNPRIFTHISKFLKHFTSLKTLVLDFAALPLYSEQLKIILQHQLKSRTTEIQIKFSLDPSSSMQLGGLNELIGTFKNFPNVKYINSSVMEIHSYENLEKTGKFLLKNIKFIQPTKIDIYLDKDDFPGRFATDVRYYIWKFSPYIQRLRYRFDLDQNPKYNGTLDSLDFPKLEYLELRNYSNAFNVFQNCPMLQEIEFNINQIFIGEEGINSDEEKIRQFFQKCQLGHLRKLTYFYKFGDKIVPGNDLERYLQNLLPNVEILSF